MKRLCWLLLIFLSVPGSGFAEPDTGAVTDLATLASYLSAPARQGRFTQQKTVAGLPLPLLSTGRYRLQDQQLYWQTESPFNSETRFTDRAIEQWEDGQLRWSLSSVEQPVVAVVSELMRALVAGDVHALAGHFAVTAFSGEAAASPEDVAAGHCWQLALTSKDPALARAVQSIEARGCARVAQIDVHEQNSNLTRIQLMADNDD